jgi:hypothetical protein
MENDITKVNTTYISRQDSTCKMRFNSFIPTCLVPCGALPKYVYEYTIDMDMLFIK